MLKEPGISSEGFLQLYCNFVTTDKFGIIFVTESQEQKYFNDFVNLSRKIYNEIKELKQEINTLKADNNKKDTTITQINKGISDLIKENKIKYSK